MRANETIPRAAPRWRVALLGGPPPVRANVGAAIRRAGGTVAIESATPDEALQVIERARPDIAIIAPEPAWPGGSGSFQRWDRASCPVVLLARGSNRRLLEEAREGGVMACLIEPVHPAQVASTLDLAVARFRDVQALRQALADRKVIERAKGLLMAREGLTENEAFCRLRRTSMDTQRPLAATARSVLLSEPVVRSQA